MKVFQMRELDAAREHAASGGQALHLHRIVFPHSPACFRAAVDRGEDIAHLFDQDEQRLITTARKCGVRVIKLEKKGTPSQHIDLCGTALRAARAIANGESPTPPSRSGFKAITICQPYADLVLLPMSDPRAKRTENRTWPSGYRGPLLIHAGKSKDWIDADPNRPGFDSFGFEIEQLVRGALIGVVDMIDCLRAEDVAKKYRQLKGHPHISGPWCHLYANVRRFVKPLPYGGQRGFFNVPDNDPFVLEQLGAIGRAPQQLTKGAS